METQLALAPAVSVEEAASLPKAGSRCQGSELFQLYNATRQCII